MMVFFTETGYDSIRPDNVSRQQLDVQVPGRAVPGSARLIQVVTPFGTANYTISIEVPMSISQILPANNYPNGPIIIWGKNLDRARSIEISGIRITGQGLRYSSGCNCLGTTLPGAIMTSPVDIQLFNSGGGSSAPVSYPIDISQTLPPVVTGAPVVLPPPAGLGGISTISNVWTLGNPATRTIVSTGLNLNPGNSQGNATEIVDGSNTVIGYWYSNPDSIVIDVNNDRYFGRGGIASQGASIILTPFVRGQQLELVFPVILESVSPTTFSRGDTITITGRYFDDIGRRLQLEFDGIIFPLDNNNFIQISDTEISVITDTSIATGTVDVTMIEALNTSLQSNAIQVTINP
ncbi:MAG: IPT/TIG domain-containing protein [Bacteroidia bacterium]